MAKARHHQVPRFLLRQFAIDGEVIQLRRDGQRKPVSVSNAAVQEHFYSFIGADGVRISELEDYFADAVDGLAAPAIRRIVTSDWTLEDLRVASRFAAFQIVRSPAFRHRDEQLNAVMGPMLAGFDAAAQYLQELGDDSEFDERTARLVFDAARADPPAEYLSVATRESQIRMLVRTAEQVLKEFEGLVWSVGVADTPSFCCSDSPAVIFKPGMAAGGLGGFTVGSGGEVRLPLSPRHVLVGSAIHLGPLQFQASREFVVSTNVLLAQECRYMIVLPPGGVAPGDPRPARRPPPLPEPTITIKLDMEALVPRAPSVGQFPPLSDPRLRSLIDATRTAVDAQSPCSAD